MKPAMRVWVPTLLWGLAVVSSALPNQFHLSETKQIPLFSPELETCPGEWCSTYPPQKPAHIEPELAPSSPLQFWLEQIKHEGTSPFIDNGTQWQVFRDVKNFGAVGDGIQDDTDAIQRAINYGRDQPGGEWTGHPSLIYLPSGTYKVSKKIQLWRQTSLVGNPLGMPVIKPTASFGDIIVVNGNDDGTQGTNNFYISIRNIQIDTTNVPASVQINAINWGVSQATSLNNVQINLPLGDCQHTGIVMWAGEHGDEGISNTMFGDIAITGGNVGIRVNGQQLLLKGIQFFGCRTAIKIDWHFLLVLQAMEFEKCGICVDDTGAGSAGLYLIDSVAKDCGIVVNGTDTDTGANSLLVENMRNTGSDVATSQSSVVLNGVTKVWGNVDTWVHGNVYIDNSDNSSTDRIQRGIQLPSTKRPQPLLDGAGNIYVKKMPQYESWQVSSFASVKAFGAKGDGRTDDTNAIVAALAANAGSKVTYFPHGVYLVSRTVTIPPGSRLVGEVWSVVSGSGGFFGNANDPKPVIQVGLPGSQGVAEITDMIFSIDDILPGAILMEINMAGATQGDVSLHNTHFRVGGTADTNVNNVCDKSPAQCKAGFLLLHATESSSAYLENVWGWTADHSLEPTYPQGNWRSTYISTGRGFLINSKQATWMLGVAPEHQTLYGLNVVDAQNVYLAMAQVETPYWQPSPPSDPSILLPAPWTPNKTYYGDPDFQHCYTSVFDNSFSPSAPDPDCFKAWGLRVSGSSHILVYGIGTWTFFENFAGNWSDPSKSACSTTSDRYCQTNAYEFVNGTRDSYFYGLATKKIRNMVYGGGGTDEAKDGVLAKEVNNPSGWGGHIVAYLGFTGDA